MPTVIMRHQVPGLPLEQIPDWTVRLAEFATQPLELCAEFPVIAARFEAWWNRAVVDRPIFMAQANTRPERPITRRLEWLADPDAWLAEKRLDLRQLHRVGDMLPHIRVDFGPVLLGSLLGGRREIGADTSWTHAFIDDHWSNAPDWTIAADRPDWLLLTQLVQMVAADAAGRYLVCTPDLGGTADVLLNLRGASRLCMDLITQPERVQAAVVAIESSWRKAFANLYARALESNAGLIHWLCLWSNRPYVVPACDFNALIGPAQFQQYFLPEIERQAEAVGRAIFHLDGPDAARHIDALLEIPAIQAIQFTPGAGNPSVLAWLDMLRKIQNRGRSLLIFTPADEVLELAKNLQPEGLAIFIESPPEPAALDNLYDQFRRSWIALRSQRE